MTFKQVLWPALAALTLVGGQAMAESDAAPLNANTATASEIAEIASLPEPLAADVEKMRPFASMVEFDSLVREHLSEDEAKGLYETLFVPVSLNDGSEEQFKFIPGITDELIHEIFEYRPYSEMTVFDEEIGKYVDESEIARLKGYLSL